MGRGGNRGYLPYNTLMIVEEGREAAKPWAKGVPQSLGQRECRKAFEIRKIYKGGTVGLRVGRAGRERSSLPHGVTLRPHYLPK